MTANLTRWALASGDEYLLDLRDQRNGDWAFPLRNEWRVVVTPDGRQTLLLEAPLLEVAS